MCMTTTNNTVCGKCGGNGQYRFFTTGKVEACFACDGTGVAKSVKRTSSARSFTAAESVAMMYEGVASGLTTINDLKACGWTLASVCALLDSVPGSREQFAALGWPV